ncbi:MAG: LysR family transcriptional regulator, partial [Hylemonella sp.]|nr:LysR family transcriptional regulator [Hylemonella sp.]
PSLSKLITVPLTHAFRDALPQAQLTLTEGFSVLMYEGLRAGRLDMTVLYNPPPSPDLETELLHEEALVLISAGEKASGRAAKVLGETVSLKELANLPLIIPSRPNAFRLLLDAEMARLGYKANIVLEIDGLNAILDLVKEGLGYAVLPKYTLSNFVKPHPMVTHKIEKPTLMSALTLVWSAKRPTTETHKVALDMVKRVVKRAIGEFG